MNLCNYPQTVSGSKSSKLFQLFFLQNKIHLNSQVVLDAPLCGRDLFVAMADVHSSEMIFVFSIPNVFDFCLSLSASE